MIVEYIVLVKLILRAGKLLQTGNGTSDEEVSARLLDALHDGRGLCMRLVGHLDIERLAVAAKRELLRASRGIDPGEQHRGMAVVRMGGKPKDFAYSTAPVTIFTKESGAIAHIVWVFSIRRISSLKS